MATEKKVGDITPFRELSRELQELVDHDREYRGDQDPVVRTLTRVGKQLEDAIERALEQELTITIDEYAEREGITKGAAYKRFQSGAIPGALKRPGQGIVIPADYATRSAA